MVVKAASAAPSFSRLSHKNTSFQNKKSLLPIQGSKDRNAISAVPPCLPEYSDRLMTAPTRRLPDNAGIASEDTRGIPLSLCPQRPICCSAFRPALSSAGLSVDALATLLPLQWFKLCYAFYTPNVSVCQALFSASGGFYSAAEGVKSENEQLEFGVPSERVILNQCSLLSWESPSNFGVLIVMQTVLLHRFLDLSTKSGTSIRGIATPGKRTGSQ